MTKGVIEKNKRSLSIDMVKGLSIMTLFFLHFENGVINTEYNFFVVRSQAFFLVIGWLWGMSSNKRTVKGHWEKRKTGLVRPYIILSLIFITFDLIMVAANLMETQILYRDIYKAATLKGMGTLWFLPALLGGEMLFLHFRDKKKIVRFFIFILSILAITTYSNYSHKEQPIKMVEWFLTTIKAGLEAFLYIYIAYYISKKHGRRIFNNWGKHQLLAMGIALLALSFLLHNDFFDYHDSLGEVIFILANVCAGIGILLFFRSIESFKPISIPLSYFGKNSLIIMAFHFCLLFQLTIAFDKHIMNNESYSGDITIIYFFIALIIQILIIEIINKHFKFIIGK
ncbi:MAG: acyltransferase [Bacteroidaceae bacterium]|nr:acyltransferase [Bacteroidaceae bacterium]